jgi:hypothetical protein
VPGQTWLGRPRMEGVHATSYQGVTFVPPSDLTLVRCEGWNPIRSTWEPRIPATVEQRCCAKRKVKDGKAQTRYPPASCEHAMPPKSPVGLRVAALHPEIPPGDVPLPPRRKSSATIGIETTGIRVVGQGRSTLRASGAPGHRE